MNNIAIKAENLSKLYRVGQFVGYKTLRESLANAFSAPFRRLRRIGDGRQETGSQPLGLRSSVSGHDNFIWALKDVSFEVEHGEVLGIIGRNGAGKTTLLKILTRITEPTEGYAEIYGRVGSLLEVGTGFHPELTGRENIYLNGAVLGMKRKEIDRKFDEIVAFAEVEKFIDTPLKRYSSGMQVRLAFSVAAHLEPEILLVDEVLAVGDAAFQKKCLGKMGDVAKEGRTVLFVSHNMGAIQRLCPRTLLLSNGCLAMEDNTQRVIEYYLSSRHQAVLESTSLYDLPRSKGLGEKIRINKCSVLDSNENENCNLLFGEPFAIYLEAIAKSEMQDLSIIIGIDSSHDDRIATPASEDCDMLFSALPSQPLRVIVRFNNFVLTPGIYWLTFGIRSGRMGLDHLQQVARLEILAAAKEGFKPHAGTWGYIHTTPHWERVDQEY